MRLPHPSAYILLLCCALLGGWPSGRGYAQLQGDTTSLVGRLIVSAQQGEVRALRDLMTLVDRPDQSTRARAALDALCLFDGQLDVQGASRQQLLDSYYANVDRLTWSSLLQVYYTVPVEQQETKYELVPLDAYQLSDRSMHLRKYIDYLEEAVEYESIEDLHSLVEKIADLQLLEGQSFLLNLQSAPAGRLLSQDPSTYRHYLEQLMIRPSVEVAELLFESERLGYLHDGSLAYYLSRLCNVPFRASWTSQQHRRTYERLLDSLGGLERVRDFGYASSLPFHRSHFREPVDYYGRVLAEAEAPDYVRHNALLDLAATQHPRALFYISTQLLAARQHRPTAHHAVHYLYLLRKLTRLGVRVPDAQDRMTYQLDVAGDPTAWINYVRYWAGHYEDYDWDEHRNSFVNRYDQSLETENLERLFRLLNSKNDAVALQAYDRIARADPLEVEQLVNKYRDLLRNTNPRVPTLKNGHLEHIAQLTAFCVRNSIPYDLGPQRAQQLDSLLSNLDPSRRVELENRLIKQLELSELTALEYWALIHQYDLEAGFSVGRILDYAYSKHWDDMLASDAHLRLYLKKAALFMRMDGIGVVDGYLRKLASVDDKLTQRLEELLISESDKHVVRAINRLLNRDHEEDSLSDLDDFLEHPEQFSREDAELLPQPSLEQLNELMWRLEDPTPKAKFLYQAYIDKVLSIELVPDLMSLLMRDESPGEVAKLLARVYHYNFEDVDGDKADLWLDQWRAKSATYLTWGEQFYGRHLARIEALEKVSGKDLNAVLRSPQFRPADRAVVIDALPRLKSNRHLFMLRFEPGLAWKERVVLSGLGLTYKDLQDLDKLFPNVPPTELIEYVMTEASDFDEEDRGKLFNAIMRKPWFDQLLDDPGFTARAGEMRAALRDYLEHSEFISEYEEQNTSLNLARLEFIGKDAVTRLRMSIELDVDEAAKLRIQESILARVRYDELPQVLALVPQLAEVNGKRPYNFLSQDFGLPIFHLESNATIEKFRKRASELTPREVYATYLSEFGIEVANDDGTLNYERIADILRYDIVLPFIGGGGHRRDFYTYGVIKLLELTEGDTLGFHEKLNENQLFYSYSASRRAAAWLSYLAEHHLGKEQAQSAPPSFNTFSAN